MILLFSSSIFILLIGLTYLFNVVHLAGSESVNDGDQKRKKREFREMKQNETVIFIDVCKDHE
jgi:hypothetical protein